MIDKSRVERLLPLEQRRDHPTDGGDEAPAQAAAGGWRVDLPQRVERCDLMFVGRRRRMRKTGRKLLNRPIEAGERLVILAVGPVALGFEALEVIFYHCLLARDRRHESRVAALEADLSNVQVQLATLKQMLERAALPRELL